MFQYKQFYVCALVDVLIKCLYEMHGVTIKIVRCMFQALSLQCCFIQFPVLLKV